MKNKNKKHRKDVYLKSNFTCVYCNLRFYPPDNWDSVSAIYRHGVFLELDHIIPVSKGGLDTIENKQSLCSICNKIKSNKM